MYERLLSGSEAISCLPTLVHLLPYLPTLVQYYLQTMPELRVNTAVYWQSIVAAFISQLLSWKYC